MKGKKNRITNIFLSGVGGQGTILASNILGEVFLKSGFDVKKAEVHGMAQRGGNVTTHFRFGDKVYSPLIKEGDVDFLLSFELLEALRYINWIKPEGKILINNQKIMPPGVSLGNLDYPDDSKDIFIKHFNDNCRFIDGQEIARKLGNIQAANVVMIGAFSNYFPDVNENVWRESIMDLLPEKLHELNINAFVEGKKSV